MVQLIASCFTRPPKPSALTTSRQSLDAPCADTGCIDGGCTAVFCPVAAGLETGGLSYIGEPLPSATLPVELSCAPALETVLETVVFCAERCGFIPG